MKGLFQMASYDYTTLPPAVIARFWAKVDKSAGPDGCWLRCDQGSDKHGRFWISQNGRKQVREGSHRFSYQLVHGAIPDGLLVCHHCDNPPCVNPKHLFLGTHKDNSQDMVRKGRSMKGDKSVARRFPETLPRGETQHLAKLTDEKVREMRRRFSKGESGNSMAPEYGVSQATIQKVLVGKAWKHVE